MMRAARLIMVALLLLPLSARAATFAIDVAEQTVDITTGFSGSHVVVFGSRVGEGPVAITLKGPRHDVTVRKKAPVLGAWMNRHSVRFENVPLYYDFAYSAPVKQIAAESILAQYGIGMLALNFNAENSRKADDETKPFQEALIRTKQAQLQFPRVEKEIRFIAPNLFRADFYLPASVPVGEYTVEAFYFEGGKLKEQDRKTMQIAQVGTSAALRGFARESGFTYGFVCVALAVFAGWFSNRVRRRA